MRYVVIGLILTVLLVVAALYVGAKKYVAHERALDAAAIAEYHAMNGSDEFLPPIPDGDVEEVEPDDDETPTPAPMTLDEWLTLDWRDVLRAELHELREELDGVQKRFRHNLWALSEGTVEWSQEWEDELLAMLAEKELVSAGA